MTPRRTGVIWQSQEHRKELALGLSPSTPSHATGFRHMAGWQEDRAFPLHRGNTQHRCGSVRHEENQHKVVQE